LPNGEKLPHLIALLSPVGIGLLPQDFMLPLFSTFLLASNWSKSLTSEQLNLLNAIAEREMALASLPIECKDPEECKGWAPVTSLDMFAARYRPSVSLSFIELLKENRWTLDMLLGFSPLVELTGPKAQPPSSNRNVIKTGTTDGQWLHIEQAIANEQLLRLFRTRAGGLVWSPTSADTFLAQPAHAALAPLARANRAEALLRTDRLIRMEWTYLHSF
jgi:hypothetical protein